MYELRSNPFLGKVVMDPPSSVKKGGMFLPILGDYMLEAFVPIFGSTL